MSLAISPLYLAPIHTESAIYSQDALRNFGFCPRSYRQAPNCHILISLAAFVAIVEEWRNGSV